MARHSTFVDAAYQILLKSGHPMTVAQIYKEAAASGLLKSKGQTPLKTLNARLSTHILKFKNESLFMRSDASRFALRQWSADVQERIVPRRSIALVEENVLAFEANSLGKYVRQNGFQRGDDSHQELLSSCFSVRRAEAEARFDIIQLISVYVVRHSELFLTYKRSKRLPEGRLHNTYSCFFGGHLTAQDLMPLFRFSDPQQALYLLDRELSEELKLRNKPLSIDFRGLLYDPRSEVSKQHIGIVFCVDLVDNRFEIGEKGFLTDAKFESLREMRDRIEDFENWSEYLIEKEIGAWNF